MRKQIKQIFDLFEETIFIPVLVMIFLVTALAYNNSNTDKFSGSIDQLYCQNTPENGDQIVVSGIAQNNSSSNGKIRLRFLVNGESVNNFYLTNPANFSHKTIGKYIENSIVTMQIYNEQDKSFVDLDSLPVNCHQNNWQNFSSENSAITISKKTIMADGRDFAVLKIILRDELDEPIIGQEIILHINDYLEDKLIKTTNISSNFTNQRGEVSLQVKYDRYDQKIDRAEIGFSVGSEKFLQNVNIIYSQSTDNVSGSLNNVSCINDQNFRPIINIEGIASDSDNVNESVKVSYYLIDLKSGKENKIGHEYTDKYHQFATSFNREIFDFGDSLDVFATDLNSGNEKYIGSITPECQIK